MSGAERAAAAAEIGPRVRELRRAAGLTQEQLAGGRFTKQYVSQIERGEVTVSAELLGWLAERLGVDRLELETGVAAGELERLERDLEAAGRLLDEHRYADALEAFRTVRESIPQAASRTLRRELTRGETWSLIRLGRVTEAAEVLVEARRAAEGAGRDPAEQAELAYLTGVCCTTLSELPAAHAEFARALDLLDAAEEPDDRLRLDVHQWRSRCYRRERDWEAAREDVERALELCAATGDRRRTAEVSFQASLVSYRLGRWVLARRQAETARDLYGELGDAVTRARVLNNLANLEYLLGNVDAAVEQLGEAFRAFVDAGLKAEAGYVLGSLAEMQRERGELATAERTARQAVELLEDRPDHVQEVGMAQLVLAQVELEQGALVEAEELLGAADASFARAGSVSHQARSLMTRGELELRRANDAEAARLYREAATALQPDDLSDRDG